MYRYEDGESRYARSKEGQQLQVHPLKAANQLELPRQCACGDRVGYHQVDCGRCSDGTLALSDP